MITHTHTPTQLVYLDVQRKVRLFHSQIDQEFDDLRKAVHRRHNQFKEEISSYEKKKNHLINKEIGLLKQYRSILLERNDNIQALLKTPYIDSQERSRQILTITNNPIEASTTELKKAFTNYSNQFDCVIHFHTIIKRPKLVFGDWSASTNEEILTPRASALSPPSVNNNINNNHNNNSNYSGNSNNNSKNNSKVNTPNYHSSNNINNNNSSTHSLNRMKSPSYEPLTIGSPAIINDDQNDFKGNYNFSTYSSHINAGHSNTNSNRNTPAATPPPPAGPGKINIRSTSNSNSHESDSKAGGGATSGISGSHGDLSLNHPASPSNRSGANTPLSQSSTVMARSDVDILKTQIMELGTIDETEFDELSQFMNQLPNDFTELQTMEADISKKEKILRSECQKAGKLILSYVYVCSKKFKKQKQKQKKQDTTFC